MGQLRAPPSVPFSRAGQAKYVALRVVKDCCCNTTIDITTIMLLLITRLEKGTFTDVLLNYNFVVVSDHVLPPHSASLSQSYVSLSLS